MTHSIIQINAVVILVPKEGTDADLVRVQLLVCDRFEITGQQFHSKSRKEEIVAARQFFSWIMNLLFKISKKRIGRYLDQHHTTVINSIQEAQNYIDTCHPYKNHLEAILKQLK